MGIQTTGKQTPINHELIEVFQVISVMASEELKIACHIGDYYTNPITDPWDKRSTYLHGMVVCFFG